MRGFGFVLVIAGTVALGWALTRDTTVMTPPQFYDNGSLRPTYVPGERVHNIGLLNERQNYVIASSVLALIGVVLVVRGAVERGRGESNSRFQVAPPRTAALPPLDERPWAAADYSVRCCECQVPLTSGQTRWHAGRAWCDYHYERART